MRRLTPDCAAELVERYLAGEEVMPLAQRFGIHRTSVYAALEKAGVERRKNRISAEDKAEAVVLYKQGVSLAKIAAKLGCSYHGIYHVLRRDGVTMRDRHWRAPKD